MARKKKKKFKRKNLFIIAAAAAATAIAGIIVIAWLGQRQPVPPVAPDSEYKEVDIYFGSTRDTYITPEVRRLRKGEVSSEIRSALEELAGGSKTGLTETIPKGTRVLGVEIKDDTAYVDLSNELRANHPGGSSGEIQTVYSIVNTVALNFPTIRNVQILVEGRAVQTLAGHIDINLPLGPNVDIIIKKENGRNLKHGA